MEQSNPESADQIIDFLSSRMGELVDGLVASYIVRYPQSRASSLSRESLDRWTEKRSTSFSGRCVTSP